MASVMERAYDDKTASELYKLLLAEIGKKPTTYHSRGPYLPLSRQIIKGRRGTFGAADRLGDRCVGVSS